MKYIKEILDEITQDILSMDDEEFKEVLNKHKEGKYSKTLSQDLDYSKNLSKEEFQKIYEEKGLDKKEYNDNYNDDESLVFECSDNFKDIEELESEINIDCEAQEVSRNL